MEYVVCFGNFTPVRDEDWDTHRRRVLDRRDCVYPIENKNPSKVRVIKTIDQVTTAPMSFYWAGASMRKNDLSGWVTNPDEAIKMNKEEAKNFIRGLQKKNFVPVNFSYLSYAVVPWFPHPLANAPKDRPILIFFKEQDWPPATIFWWTHDYPHVWATVDPVTGGIRNLYHDTLKRIRAWTEIPKVPSDN